MTISEGSWLWYHILSSETQLDVLAQFIIYFDLENVSNQSQTLVLFNKVELIIEIQLFNGSKLAKDDNVIWIWTVVPHLVCMCGGLWISLQLICIGADITVFSLLLQLTEDDDFIGVRTVVPHVVTTDPVLLLSSNQCISVYPSIQSCPKMTIS